ncbi:MAG: hypothetical protein VR64_15575 [Desulfatitalea sp. BRH_c12]|nr:MAG: hypothetical protein VR64_15575 [Desulfatitalea sp. BRH_c12]
MQRFKVTVFKPFPFEKGQKIRINGGKRNGDWEVIGISDTKVTLRCPLSGRQFEWDRFCYLADVLDDEIWPESH